MKEQQLTDKVSFDIIRYANCWEDAGLVLRGLQPVSGNRILSVGSAGDNSFSILTTDPELVVAVDVNQVQLWLIELKAQVIRALEYEEVLQFLGFQPSEHRLAVFDAIKSGLSTECRAFWETKRPDIGSGIIHHGKFESYFRFFVERILPWIHSRKDVQRLLEPKSAQEQQLYYTQHWDTWRWRFFFRLFFSRYVMGKYGRDPEFLRQVTVPVSKTIYERAGAHLQSEQAQHNFILRYTLTGSFGNLLPHYLQPAHFDQIKERLNNLVLYKGYAQDASTHYGKFHSMNLSNIFEYMNKEVFEQTAVDLADSLEKDGRMAYWNLMVPRRLSAAVPETLMYLENLSTELTAVDNGFFYQQYLIDQKR